MATLSWGRTAPLGRDAHAHSALVVTVVHNPEDSRIRRRQLAALLAAEWDVTYVAPFDAFGLDDYVAPWLADLMALALMFALIAALGATSNERRPHSP